MVPFKALLCRTVFFISEIELIYKQLNFISWFLMQVYYTFPLVSYCNFFWSSSLTVVFRNLKIFCWGKLLVCIPFLESFFSHHIYVWKGTSSHSFLMERLTPDLYWYRDCNVPVNTVTHIYSTCNVQSVKSRQWCLYYLTQFAGLFCLSQCFLTLK